MASVYPFLSVFEARSIEIKTLMTPGIAPVPVLDLKINDENGFPLCSLHITGLPTEQVRRLVAASAKRRPELVR